jgi:tetratricopeptide (TPR) repeat protein
MKDRKVFGVGNGYLTQYGKVWRTGANAGTFIDFDKEISFGGANVAAGRYLIFSVPNVSEWDIMLYSDLSIGGNVGAYDKANEVIRVKAKSTKLTEKVDAFTINLANISADSKSAHLQITWENTAVNIPIEVNFDKEVEASIAANTTVNPGNLLAAATYYLANEKNLDQALEYVETYLSTGKNSEQFWNIHVKAQILAKLGKTKEAIKTAEQSLADAKAADGDFGYIKINEDFIAGLKK